MKRLSLCVLAVCLTLAACSPAVGSTPTASVTPAATTVEPVTPAPTQSATSAATETPTPQPIGTLDVSSLPTKLPHSAKGYELYSWQVNGTWNYTLITGTNRTKALDEITAPGNSVSSDGIVKISASSLDDLKLVLGRLPRGESILWGGIDLGGEVPSGTAYLTFPPQALMDEVKADCTSLGLTLTSLKQ